MDELIKKYPTMYHLISSPSIYQQLKEERPFALESVDSRGKSFLYAIKPDNDPGSLKPGINILVSQSAFVKGAIVVWEDGRAEIDYPLIGESVSCSHEFVNVGFTTIKMVCKHCDKEK